MSVFVSLVKAVSDANFKFCEDCAHVTAEGMCQAPQMSHGMFKGDVEIECVVARQDGMFRSWFRRTCGVTGRFWRYAAHNHHNLDYDALRANLKLAHDTVYVTLDSVGANRLKIKYCGHCVHVFNKIGGETFFKCGHADTKQYCDHETSGKFRGCTKWEEPL